MICGVARVLRAGAVEGPGGLAYTRSTPPRFDNVNHSTSSRFDGVLPSDRPQARVLPLSREVMDSVLVPALDEDGIAPPAFDASADGRARATDNGTLPSGRPGQRRVDLCSDLAIPALARARGELTVKAPGILCGVGVFARALELCDPDAQIEVTGRDGDRVVPGTVVLRVLGRARALLYAERTGLNFVQRLSGIATSTARYVSLCAGRARVLDTRKTTPNLRALEKYAVRCGGGVNHRFGLYDEAMLKNNHVDLAGRPLIEVLRGLRLGLSAGVRITCEARDLAEAGAGVEGDADVVLLDNFTAGELALAVPILRASARGRSRPLEIEASGGITEENVAAVAASGVDRISVGALTHSVTALDLSFYLRPAL